MAYCGQGQKVQKVMVQPINLIFRYLQSGFDEYMNLVLDDAEEIHSKTKSRKQLGVSCVCATRVTCGMKPARINQLCKGGGKQLERTIKEDAT
ncbi:small nuclear ribonucleoprotein E-like isoform X1 [Anser cygnoides]